jgi:hypothetical protein
VRIGDRDWQTGDLLHTRRNDRTLAIHDQGDGHADGVAHVRNGDRWRVLAADETGLHVEHLDRPGRDGHGALAFLPADYVAAHADYGWATTITAAQGATVDVGLVLVRPGIDREHLYVALTRGRQANHAYITPDPAHRSEIDDHGPPAIDAAAVGRTTLEQRTHEVLADAISRSGGQDAAHTVRENARTRAVEHARTAAEAAARKAVEPVMPPEHAAHTAQLTQRQHEYRELAQTRSGHARAAADARAMLADTPGWRRGRTAGLRDTINHHQNAAASLDPELARLEREIATLSRHVDADTRQREHDNNRRTLQASRPRTDRIEGDLAPPRAARGATP